MSDIAKPTILSVGQIFEKTVHLPEYQRPYKWQGHHVKQLLHDLADGFRDNQKQYRLGTLVLHNHNRQLDIVDGQQRLTTLSLILHALDQSTDFLEQKFSHSISQKNIRSNYQTIKDYLEGSGLQVDDFTQYILQKCELVYIELSDLDEAFQFFDSQNARGKSLEPYDLLKAYHLRAMPADTLNLLQYVENWERAVNENPTLNVVISQVLYRLRQWNRNKRAEIFTSNDLQVLKGVNEQMDYPYLQAMKSGIALHMAQKINPLMSANEYLNPPFQITQTILNGRLFFEYVEYYRKLYQKLFSEHTGILVKGGWLERLKYQGNHRTGDRWLRRVFECAVLMYYDKFGEYGLETAVNRVFRWAFTVRLEYQSIRWGRIEKIVHGAENPSLLKCIALAEQPSEVADFTVEKPQAIKYHNAELEKHLYGGDHKGAEENDR